MDRSFKITKVIASVSMSPKQADMLKKLLLNIHSVPKMYKKKKNSISSVDIETKSFVGEKVFFCLI